MSQNPLPRFRETFMGNYWEIKDRLDNLPESQEAVESDAQKNWVEPYLEIRERGFAYLQRRRRLIEERKRLYKTARPTAKWRVFSVFGALRTALQSYFPKKVGADDKQLPTYETACSDAAARMNQDIQQLLEEYWNTCKLARDMDAQRIRTWTVKRTKLLWNWYGPGGQLYAWVFDCAKCASTGGCCGRDCGCCGKPLIEYSKPMKLYDAEDRALIGVYGHCTAECPCCIRVRGRYHPDPRLPPLDV